MNKKVIPKFKYELILDPKESLFFLPSKTISEAEFNIFNPFSFNKKYRYAMVNPKKNSTSN